jgi:hypothetical protein
MTLLGKLKEMRDHINSLRLDELDQQQERRTDEMHVLAGTHGGAASAFDTVIRMIDELIKDGDPK